MPNIEKLTENLKKHGFDVSYYETGAEAVKALTEKIQGKTVGIGGSKTVEALGLFEALTPGNQVSWHWKKTSPDANDVSARAQVYLCSANGVAETGEIINIDGTGNRIAAAEYGREAVYIIIGVNKIAPDYESALWRARNIAAPLNAKRLDRKTPCALSAEMKCYDCDSPERICRGLSVFYRKLTGVKTCEVVIINEELGY